MRELFRRLRWIVPATGVFVGILGTVIGTLGAWLLYLGGTPYYLIAGILLLLSGILIAIGRQVGAWIYALVLVGTIAWAIYESGLDGWALIPRLIAPLVLGIWIFSPWVAGRVYRETGHAKGEIRTMSWGGMLVCLVLIGLVFAAGYRITDIRYTQAGEPSGWDAADEAFAAVPASGNEWHSYGGTYANDRFSKLAQITPQNVGKLQKAWSFSTGDMPKKGENKRGREFSFEATPIKVGNSLYFCTPHRDVIALDATTGKQLWRYEPDGDMSHNIYQACRGVSYFEAPEGTTCRRRIISTASGVPHLFALDAATGKLCETFGDNGMIDLRRNMGPVPPGFHFITSPPLVVKGKIILSGWVYDNQTVGEPSGVIRAFGAVDGHLAWSWDMGRSPPTKPLGPDETYTRGTPNGWGVYSAIRSST